MNYAAQTSDPATFEIVKNSLYKIAEEMRVVLAKTAYSPLLKSAGDYSCGLFDARGAMQRTCTKATSLFTTIPISAAATCPT
jgi:N-methylhydantoinase B/oxoprolinase/acetone carboxylase alpha subunit